MTQPHHRKNSRLHVPVRNPGQDLPYTRLGAAPGSDNT
jgi:hypothetical protein